MRRKIVRITHGTTGLPIAEGPVGWGITPFEGNFYIRKRHRSHRHRRPWMGFGVNWNLEAATDMMPSLVGHLIYGAILGGFYARLRSAPAT